jgi:hypothetical protein
MEDISSMTVKDLLINLKKYKQYENETDYYIKKSIGKEKLATVDELKKELTQLSSKQIPVISNINTNIVYVLEPLKEAQMMVNIILTYNKYKGNPHIKISFPDKTNDNTITVDYNKYNQSWELNIGLIINTQPQYITYKKVIKILTKEIIKNKKGENINFTDAKNHNIAYHQLINIKNHTNISKTYLAMYELLIKCEQK